LTLEGPVSSIRMDDEDFEPQDDSVRYEKALLKTKLERSEDQRFDETHRKSTVL
jgi:hypothetical protein